MSDVIAALEALAPPSLAAGWDNVGLLIEPRRPIRRVLLTVDLTEAVLAEAADVDLIVAYHPPIFSGLKRLTSATPTGRVVLDCVRAGMGVYSPHTALDAVAGGLNDWLLEPFGCLASSMPAEPTAADPSLGYGRVASLVAPIHVDALLPRLKAHLGLDTVRVAGAAREVRTVAVCPGAGGGVFERVGAVDLLLTGELRHHDVLARVAGGAVVVLTDHTNTERGYLPRLADALRDRTGAQVRVSAVDADPLRLR